MKLSIIEHGEANCIELLCVALFDEKKICTLGVSLCLNLCIAGGKTVAKVGAREMPRVHKYR